MTSIEKAAELIGLHDMLEKQRQLAIELKRIKDEESDLRDEICDYLASKGFTEYGTQRIKDVIGLNVKIVRKINYSLNAKELDDIYDDLSEEEQACIKFKPELVIGKYNKLDCESELDNIIIAKDAKPSLEVTLAEE